MASRGSVRHIASDDDRKAFDDPLERVALDDRPPDSRGGERPKASRSSSRRTHAQSDSERLIMEPSNRERFVDSSVGDRPKASRDRDRLKSRGGDRGRRKSSEEHEQLADRPEQRAADRADHYEAREQDININQGKPLTLEDWFSNPGRLLRRGVVGRGVSCSVLTSYTVLCNVQPISFRLSLGRLQIAGHCCHLLTKTSCTRRWTVSVCAFHRVWARRGVKLSVYGWIRGKPSMRSTRPKALCGFRVIDILGWLKILRHRRSESKSSKGKVASRPLHLRMPSRRWTLLLTQTPKKLHMRQLLCEKWGTRLPGTALWLRRVSSQHRLMPTLRLTPMLKLKG